MTLRDYVVHKRVLAEAAITHAFEHEIAGCKTQADLNNICSEILEDMLRCNNGPETELRRHCLERLSMPDDKGYTVRQIAEWVSDKIVALKHRQEWANRTPEEKKQLAEQIRKNLADSYHARTEGGWALYGK